MFTSKVIFKIIFLISIKLLTLQYPPSIFLKVSSDGADRI